MANNSEGLHNVHIPHPRHRLEFPLPSLAKQSFRDEANINNIMARYERTGIIEHQNKFNGQYGDFTSDLDYHGAMNQVIAAQNMFETLPAKVRAKFNNDPGQFLEFADNPENSDELIEMGLASAPENVTKSTGLPDPEPEPEPAPDAS